MIKGKKNQLANVGNRFQTKTKKVLCVCSAGLLRSPTLANVLNLKYGFNTRAWFKQSDLKVHSNLMFSIMKDVTHNHSNNGRWVELLFNQGDYK